MGKLSVDDLVHEIKSSGGTTVKALHAIDPSMRHEVTSLLKDAARKGYVKLGKGGTVSYAKSTPGLHQRAADQAKRSADLAAKNASAKVLEKKVMATMGQVNKAAASSQSFAGKNSHQLKAMAPGGSITSLPMSHPLRAAHAAAQKAEHAAEKAKPKTNPFAGVHASNMTASPDAKKGPQTKHTSHGPVHRDGKHTAHPVAAAQSHAAHAAAVSAAKQSGHTVTHHHATYGPVMKGPKGGSYVIHNGKKYYGNY